MSNYISEFIEALNRKDYGPIGMIVAIILVLTLLAIKEFTLWI